MIWQLKKVLPGQRNGAQRWFTAFTDFLKGIGFEHYDLTPAVLRHCEKKILISVRADDELVAAESKAEI